MTNEYFTTPITEGMKCGWTVTIDGVVTVVSQIVLESPMGRLEYGRRPEGYDGWAFAEKGGGGSCTIPYSHDPEGQLWLGLILENRANMGGERWCVVGGFKDPNETHKQAAAREALEETGFKMPEATPTTGLPVISNRLFFVADPTRDEGVHLFLVNVPWEALEAGEGAEQMKLRPSYQTWVQKGQMKLRLMPWRQAARLCPDPFLHASILADLL
ncbi:MAG: NUDIX domain-containing protein [Patescibacteria group bacterium]